MVDLAAAAPGMVLEPLPIGPVSRSTLALFAGASGDHQPLHIDHEYAQAAGMDDVFAHGLLLAAYVGRFLNLHFNQISLRELDVRFVAVTPVNASPTCYGKIMSIDTVGGERRATASLWVELEDGTRVCEAHSVCALLGHLRQASDRTN